MEFQPAVKVRTASTAAIQACEPMDLHPVAKLVLANRASKYDVVPDELVANRLTCIARPDSLPDIDVGADRLIDAMVKGEVICLETDHDVDGVTSHAVLFRALVDYFNYPREKIRSYIGHRLNEGYGLSQSLAERILNDAESPTLIITADNGSSDEARIAFLKERGIDTIVTDHHGMPEEGPPKSAIACISPAREDSGYPDPLIAGVMVAWLFMAQTRIKLIERGVIASDTPKLSRLLDFVALGTVADCVSLTRSVTNRAVINYGLAVINQLGRPCWRAVKPYLGDIVKPISEEDLGFGIGPRINAVGRLDDAMVGVKFLLAENDADAEYWTQEIDAANGARKEIEAILKEEAVVTGQEAVDSGKHAVIVKLKDGHAGVHGIVASRLVERFGRPSICFSDKQGQPGVITGSARGVDGMHVREALQAVADNSDIFDAGNGAFGGHSGAAGCTLKAEKFEEFCNLYQAEVDKQLNGALGGPVVYSDGEISPAHISYQLINGLKQIGPFGREFDSPAFHSEFRVNEVKAMGKDKKHWKLKLLSDQGVYFDAVWFNVGTDAPCSAGSIVKVLYTISEKWWQGKSRIQLMIKTIF